MSTPRRASPQPFRQVRPRHVGNRKLVLEDFEGALGNWGSRAVPAGMESRVVLSHLLQVPLGVGPHVVERLTAPTGHCRCGGPHVALPLPEGALLLPEMQKIAVHFIPLPLSRHLWLGRLRRRPLPWTRSRLPARMTTSYRSLLYSFPAEFYLNPAGSAKRRLHPDERRCPDPRRIHIPAPPWRKCPSHPGPFRLPLPTSTHRPARYSGRGFPHISGTTPDIQLDIPLHSRRKPIWKYLRKPAGST